MKVTELDERVIQDIGHAFGYYDYGQEHGLIDAFPSRTQQRPSSAATCAWHCGAGSSTQQANGARAILPRVYLKTHDVTGSEGFLRCARHFFAGILTYFKEK